MKYELKKKINLNIKIIKLEKGTAKFGKKNRFKKKKIKDNQFKKIKSFLIKSNINKHIFKK